MENAFSFFELLEDCEGDAKYKFFELFQDDLSQEQLKGLISDVENKTNKLADLSQVKTDKTI